MPDTESIILGVIVLVVMLSVGVVGFWALSDDRTIPTDSTNPTDPTTRTDRATAIDSCTTLTRPGRYVLTADLENSRADTCIRIRSSDVVLDGAGRSVDGVGAFGSAGVLVGSGRGDSLSNVTVRNVTVTDWDDGIRYLNVHDGAVIDTTTSNNRVGLSLLGSTGNALSNNTARSNRLHGISILDRSENNTLSNNTATSNALFGIHLVETGARGNVLSANNASDNEFGIVLIGVRNSTLTDNTARSNRIAGVWLSAADDNDLSGNVVSNRFYGIFLADRSEGNAISNNTADSNAVGIRLRTSHDNAIVRNRVTSNSDNGILLIASDRNRIAGNYGGDNARGITLIDSHDNVRSNNTVDGSGRQGSRIGPHDGPERSEPRVGLERMGVGLERMGVAPGSTTRYRSDDGGPSREGSTRPGDGETLTAADATGLDLS